MNRTEIPKEVVSVSEMARLVGLSRARFYQLVKEGVFPPPSRNDETKRPFYNRAQQEKCLEVRKTNCGANGKATLFYAMRAAASPPSRPRSRQNRVSRSLRARNQSSRDATISELRHGLTQLGVEDVTDARLRTALAEMYPDGHRDVEAAELLRAVFGRLRCQN